MSRLAAEGAGAAVSPPRRAARALLRLSRSRRLRRGLAASLVLGLTAAAVAFAVLWSTSPLDRAELVRPDDSLEVVDRHGTPLRHVRSEGLDRRWVELEQVSPHLIDAVLAVEDSRFYQHGGVDFIALVRAFIYNILPGGRLSGASTISQQVIKLAYGRPRGLWSKPSEVVRAIRLEQELSKEEILEQYLNRLPYGDQIVGVARASEEYFDRPVSELSVGEAALLAGIPQAPSVTEPRRHLDRSLARRSYVLHRMRVTGRIDEVAYQAALEEVPQIHQGEARPWRAPRYVDSALRSYRRGELERDGRLLRTSLDLALQREVETVLRRQVTRLSDRGVEQASAIALANATGEVLAYVGAARRGPDHPAGQMDLLTAPRQPGSTLKPFVYELLFEQGGTAATVLDDLARPMTGAGETIFEAEDYDGQERGPVRARVALASSLNLAALDAARRVGPHRIIARLRALGVDRLEAADHYGAAVVLGGADVAPLELAQAYTALARGGTAISISLAPGGSDAEPLEVMERGPVAVVIDVLRDGRARADAFGDDLGALLDEEFGLKTGTSSGWHDAWAAVFTDLVTVVVWLGDPEGHPLGAVSGFEGAAEPAVRILAAAHGRARELGLDSAAAMAMSEVSGQEPVELVSAEICAASGLLAGDRCPHQLEERFVPGTTPSRRCRAHRDDGSWVLPPRYADWIARTGAAGVVIDREAAAHPEAELRIIHPSPGARWLLDLERGTTAIPLRAELAGATASAVRWEVDGAVINGQHWTASSGRHTFVAILDEHRSRPVEVEVVEAGGS